MPDFTIETAPMCKTNDHWEKKYAGSTPGSEYTVTFGDMPPNHRYQKDYTCTCPAFKYAKKGQPRSCKHIQQAEKDRCGWNGEMSPQSMPEGEKCPQCQGPLMFERVAV